MKQRDSVQEAERDTGRKIKTDTVPNRLDRGKCPTGNMRENDKFKDIDFSVMPDSNSPHQSPAAT